jgi:S1-C subfamily serine protease
METLPPPSPQQSSAKPTETNASGISREQLLRNPQLLAQISPELPASVKAAAEAIVSIHVATAPPTDYVNASGEIQKTSGGDAFQASGSVVVANGRRVVLTAGHVQAPAESHCGDEEVHYQNSDGAILGATKQQYLDYEKAYVGMKPDIGVIVPGTDKGRSNDGQQQPVISLPKAASPALGDEVFVMGYPDPRPGEERRDPGNYQPLNTPSIHSAMVLGTTQQGYVALLEGGGNTYAPGDKYNTTMSGNSGGALVAEDGYQIGVISGAASAPANTAYVAEQYGVTLSDPAHYQLAYAELVTQTSVDSLAVQATQSPRCEALPHPQQPVS